MRKILIVAAVGLGVSTAGIASAQSVAQEQTTTTTYVGPAPTYVAAERVTRPGVRSNAPANAFEIGLQTGWTQGFGNYASAARAQVHDLVNSGGAVELQLGYRFDPHWMLGLYGSGEAFGTGGAVPRGNTAWSSTAGIQGAFHFTPHEPLDPFISIGSGWRGLWVNTDFGTDSSHGMDLARAQVGVDFRVSPMVSIAPVFGATMSMFFTHEPIGGNNFSNVSSPELSTFLFGGLMGRFDVGQEQAKPVTPAVAKR
jgi:hypothetical protein